MRSAVEEQLDLIAHGKANFKSVLKHTLEVFKLKFQYFVKNIEGMDQLFEVSFSSLAESGRPFSRCGKCRRYMKYIIAKPTRLYCQNCDETMVLPQNGNIKLHQELKCPLDDYELLHCSAGAKGKSFIFCPYCYSNPPFPGKHLKTIFYIHCVADVYVHLILDRNLGNHNNLVLSIPPYIF